MVLKNIRETTLDRTFAEVQKYLRHNTLIAVAFDSGIGFCVIKKSSHAKKLEKTLDCKQFRKLSNGCDNFVMKMKKN